VTNDLSNAAVMRTCFEAPHEHLFHRERLIGIDDWRAVPAIDKHDLLPALEAFSVHDEARGVHLVRSGGSTQEPLIFPVDIAENQAQRATLAEPLRETGVFGTRMVAPNLFGYSDLHRTFGTQ
jgi:phenylacetate-CoA ligase